MIFFTVENLEHNDFIALRNMVIRTHLQDLKDVTNNVHYENFRCRTLAGLSVDGKPVRVSNKWVDPKKKVFLWSLIVEKQDLA